MHPPHDDDVRGTSGPDRPRPRPDSADTIDVPASSASGRSRADREAIFPPVDASFYAVEGEFARGGQGRVFRAHDRRLDRQVAIKEVRDGRDQRWAVRFEREALITARLQHPSIVPIYEAGRWPDGRLFYAMKLVTAESLGHVVARTRSLAERLALLPNIVQVAGALAYAHDQRIIHRDRAPVAAERTFLLQKVYDMTEAQYRQYWIAKVFRAEATSGPRVVVSSVESVELVSVLSGAIVLMDASDVPAGLKVLQVDGLLPGSKNYALKQVATAAAE